MKEHLPSHFGLRLVGYFFFWFCFVDPESGQKKWFKLDFFFPKNFKVNVTQCLKTVDIFHGLKNDLGKPKEKNQ